MKTAIIAGTGPSLDSDTIKLINSQKGKIGIFGCNNTIFSLNLDVHHACNYQWHDYYAERIKYIACDKWTTRPEVADRYPWILYIAERWIPGLSTDPSFIAAHHGSGPQLLNLALKYGYNRMLLSGWDMRHRGERHYFGEYPEPLLHYTKNLGPNGELIGLIKEMETIHPSDYGIEIINCTPGSALTHFPMGELRDYVK